MGIRQSPADHLRESVICNICNSGGTAVFWSSDDVVVRKCGGCGTAFTHPQPEHLADQYDAGYFDLYARRRSFRLKRASKRLSKIELLKPLGRILDVGCSLGYFVEAALTRGWDAYGVEISEHASGVAAKSGLKVKQGVLEAADYEDGFFDCVTMWDVLEHVPDPTCHMLEVRRILKPGGLVVIGTPNLSHPAAVRRMARGGAKWRHFKPREHIFYFTPHSLRLLLEKCGFHQTTPPLIPRRISLLTAALGEGLSRLLPLNDVMVAYGVAYDKQV